MRTPLLLLGMVLVLFIPTAWAAPKIRVSAIEPYNQSDELQTTIPIDQLKDINIIVQNAGDAPCTDATVEMDINQEESRNSVIINGPIVATQSMAAGSQAVFVFTKDQQPNLFSLTSTPEGVYRITAIARCDTEWQHARALVFSVVSNQKTNVPESKPWVVLIIGLATVALLFDSPRAEKREKDRTQD